MPRGFVKLNDGERDWYFEWSTVVDAPTTMGMTLQRIEEYVIDEFGNRSMNWWGGALERLERKGTSFMNDESHLDTLRCNRAGACESCLSPEQIVESYGRQKSMGRDGRCLLKGGHTHSGPEATDDWCRWDEDPPRPITRSELADLKNRNKGGAK